MKRSLEFRFGPILLVQALLASGCASTPPPRTVYQDQLTAIRLQVDDRASVVHSHPAQISPDQMAKVLNGVRAVPRKGYLGSMITGETQANPAFSIIEIQALAPQLSRALAEARPEELITFYRRYTDVGTGLAVTSGALFLQDNHLYFILANNRNLPSDAININQVYEIDPIDNPLLPIKRETFRALFVPTMALVPPDERRPWPYIDDGRVLVIDRAQLAREMRNSSSKPADMSER